MGGMLGPYIEPILNALLVFPLVAYVLTLPYCALNYRRFGGIAPLRTAIFYSFILYVLCAFLLTVLPLPDIEEVLANGPTPVQPIPFGTLTDGMAKVGLDVTRPATLLSLAAWAKYLSSTDFFEIVANVIMLVPLGVYLRYFFRCRLRTTLIIGFCVSLFFEITQYSGLYGIYPWAYRFPDADDLICNTLGALIGYGITPVIALILPSRERIDYLSWKSGEKVGIIRTIVAFAVDAWIVANVYTVVVIGLNLALGRSIFASGLPNLSLLFAFAYFCLVQYATKGVTLGKKLLRLRLVRLDEPDAPPRLGSLAIRYALICLVVPAVLLVNALAVGGALMLIFMDNPNGMRFVGLALCAAVVFGTLIVTMRLMGKSHRWPHDALSKTMLIDVRRPDAPGEGERAPAMRAASSIATKFARGEERSAEPKTNTEETAPETVAEETETEGSATLKAATETFGDMPVGRSR